MTTIQVLFVGNDNILEVASLRDELTGAFLSAATVSVILFDSDGDEVGGGVWPLALAYVAASRGVYRAMLPYTLTLVPDGRYQAEVTVDAGSGLHAVWEIDCVARARS